MTPSQLFLDRFAIDWLYGAGSPVGILRQGAYWVVPSDRFADSCLTFVNRAFSEGQDLPDVVGIALVKELPENQENYRYTTFVRCDDPRSVFAHLTARAWQDIPPHSSWHFPAQASYVDPTADVHATAVISQNVYVSAHTRIGANTVIGHAGFGFGRIDDQHAQLFHVGGVMIDRDCHIGMNCTVASGTFLPTSVGANTIVDDHVHIAHNCKVGVAATLTAGTTLSGSVSVGDGVWLGPNSSVLNGASLGPKLFVGIGSVVTKSIDGGSVAGNPARKLPNT